MNRLLKLLPLFALGAATASAQVVVAAWDTWSTNVNAPSNVLSADADFTAPGISAFVGGNVNPDFPATGGGVALGAFGSTDGTFGSLSTPTADQSAGGSNNRINLNFGSNNNRRLDFSITNNTGSPLQLDAIHFDYNPTTNGAVTINIVHFKADYNLGANTTSNLDDANNATVLDFTSLVGNTGGAMNDVTASIQNSLVDSILADGQTASFRIQSADNNTFISFGIDNLAITGTTVPEPSTYAILAGFAALGFVMVRRRRK